MTILPEDKAFYQQLHDYAAKSQETVDPIVPLFFEADGRINREKTLGLPCFAELGADSEKANERTAGKANTTRGADPGRGEGEK